jgi:hypothetical protein
VEFRTVKEMTEMAYRQHIRGNHKITKATISASTREPPTHQHLKTTHQHPNNHITTLHRQLMHQHINSSTQPLSAHNNKLAHPDINEQFFECVAPHLTHKNFHSDECEWSTVERVI